VGVVRVPFLSRVAVQSFGLNQDGRLNREEFETWGAGVHAGSGESAIAVQLAIYCTAVPMLVSTKAMNLAGLAQSWGAACRGLRATLFTVAFKISGRAQELRGGGGIPPSQDTRRGREAGCT